MRKIFMIANQFPPMGGSGVQRSLKFVKFLREFSYESLVFTRECGQGLLDESLNKDIPIDTEIIRTRAYDLASYTGLFGKLLRGLAKKIIIPDLDYIWYKKSLPLAIDRLKKGDIDLIYSTSFPYSDHLLGLDLKKAFPHIPWLVDFRDEWTNNPYILDMNYPNWRIKKEKAMEAEVIATCDAFVTNTDKMLEGFLRDYPQLKGISYVIPNGFDDADFDKNSADLISKDLFRISYAGSMYGRRSPKLLLASLRALIDKGLINKNDLDVHFIGHMQVGLIEAMVREYDLTTNVKLHSYMAHKEVLVELSKASALILIIGPGLGAENFSSGKIFEYIHTNRKILALVPKNGEAAKIIRQTHSGIVCDSSNQEEIEAGILRLYNEWRAGDYYPRPNLNEVFKYHRREQAKDLAHIFDGLLEKNRKL